nr:MAG TPA: hypothetical protein [Caudoviricetes sp.]
MNFYEVIESEFTVVGLIHHANSLAFTPTSRGTRRRRAGAGRGRGREPHLGEGADNGRRVDHSQIPRHGLPPLLERGREQLPRIPR